MGLFSRHQTVPLKQTMLDEKIYVFIRASDTTPRAEITWSLVVSEESRLSAPSHTSFRTDSQQEQKKKTNFLSLGSRKHSSKSSISTPSTQSHSPSVSPTPTRTLHEFTLSSGNLNITLHRHSSPQSTYDPNSESLLVQVLLPLSPISRTSSQPLALQIEQSLHRITSATAHLADHDSDIWLKLALVALQNERHLAPATTTPGAGAGNGVGNVTFNAERFMDFARNALTGFEGEILQHQDDFDENSRLISEDVMIVGTGDAKHIKHVDYAAYVRESERLRAMFGQTSPGAGLGEERKSRMGTRGSSKQSGYFVSVEESGARTSRLSMRQDRDVYAGLM